MDERRKMEENRAGTRDRLKDTEKSRWTEMTGKARGAEEKWCRELSSPKTGILEEKKNLGFGSERGCEAVSGISGQKEVCSKRRRWREPRWQHAHQGRGGKQGWRGWEKETDRCRQARDRRSGWRITPELWSGKTGSLSLHRLPLPHRIDPEARPNTTGASVRLCHLDPQTSQSTHSRDASWKRGSRSPPLRVSPCLRRPKYQRTNPPDSGRRSASSALPLAPFPWML